MKKILFVVDERMMGGVSILLEDILNSISLDDKEIDVLVLHDRGDRFVNLDKRITVFYGTSFFSAIDYTLKDAFKTKKASVIFSKLRTVFYLKTGLIKSKIKKERKQIIKKKYDVEIAFKDAFPTLFTGYGDTPIKIGWLHSDYNQTFNPTSKYKRLFKACYTSFYKVIAVSNGVKKDFNRIFRLGERVAVINNMVNEAKINRVKRKEPNHRGLRIVSVGRLHPHKGYDRLLEAINQLDEELLEDVKIEIYGDGPDKGKLNEMVVKYELNDIVEFKGFINNPYEAINGADLFVLSSTNESFGIVIIEAMLMGVPVLATANSATGELIKNNVNGKIVNNSIEGLCLGLRDLLINRNKIDDYKEELKDYKYDNAQIIKKIEELISE